jgi:hypothetical protein
MCNTLRILHFFQNNSQIQIVERYKYLGIVFYFNSNLKHAADDLLKVNLIISKRVHQNWYVEIIRRHFVNTRTFIRPLLYIYCRVFGTKYRLIYNLLTLSIHDEGYSKIARAHLIRFLHLKLF